MMFEALTREEEQAVREILTVAPAKPGMLFVVGCSSSEMVGEQIGKHSSYEAAEAVFAGIYPVLCEKGLFLAAQCCEHLNRALILEEKAAQAFGYDPVMVVPQPKAGGSFATVTYRSLQAVSYTHLDVYKRQEYRLPSATYTRRSTVLTTRPLLSSHPVSNGLEHQYAYHYGSRYKTRKGYILLPSPCSESAPEPAVGRRGMVPQKTVPLKYHKVSL